MTTTTSPGTPATTAVEIWNTWNSSGGPRYPHEKAVQFTFRSVPADKRAAARALDAGCGGGVHTAFLAREKLQVTAFDIATTGVQHTNARLDAEGLRAEVFASAIQDVSLPSDTFDLVLCIGVLDCAGVDNAKHGVGRIAASMKQGGRGVFVFASDVDFRIQGAQHLALHGFTRAEVESVFAPGLFSEVFIDRYITTYRGGEHQQNDWLVTVQK